MKRIMLILSIIMLVSMLVWGISCAKPAPAPEAGPLPTAQTFKFYVYNGNADIFEVKWEMWWMAELAKRTNDLMKFEFYLGPQHGQPLNQLVRTCGDGICDLAGNMDVNEAGNIPEFTIGCLPLLFEDFRQYEKWREEFEPKLAKVLLDKFNVVLVASTPIVDHGLATNKPVRKLDDLKGMKIRVISEAEGQFFKAVGAVPVTMMWPEIYGAFQRGVLDGMTMYPQGLIDYKFYEVSKFFPMKNVRTPMHMLVMNRDVYDKLPPLFKKAVEDMRAPYLKHCLESLAEMEKTAYNDLPKLGVDVTMMPESEIAKAREIAVAAWETFATKHGPVAQEGLKLARQITKH